MSSRPRLVSYDGHTLETVIPAIETAIGACLDKIVADAGYRGHNAPEDKGVKVYVAGQKRGPAQRAGFVHIRTRLILASSWLEK